MVVSFLFFIETHKNFSPRVFYQQYLFTFIHSNFLQQLFLHYKIHQIRCLHDFFSVLSNLDAAENKGRLNFILIYYRLLNYSILKKENFKSYSEHKLFYSSTVDFQK